MLLPIQMASPLALSGERWMGEAECAAMTPKYCADVDEMRLARAAREMDVYAGTR